MDALLEKERIAKMMFVLRTLSKRTQSRLTKSLKVSFQQIQKYEKGTNAVSSLGLLRLANFFKVPITYFYEGYSEYQIPKEPTVITVKEAVNEV